MRRVLSVLYFALLVPAMGKIQGWRGRGPGGSAPLSARDYRPGDERGILRLFHLTFRQGKSLSRWKWEFLDNPYGVTNIGLLECGKAGIVGHAAGILVRFQCQGKVVPASQAADLMIHPAFRSRAAFEHLGRIYVEKSRENRIELLYGFNESVVARSHRRFFGAELVPVSEWVLQIPGARSSTAPADDSRISRATAFDARSDALWDRIKASYPYGVVRDSRYLNWRYAPRSDREYSLWELTDPSSGEISALAVLGAHESDGLILELLSDPADTESITAILRASIAHFAQAGKLRVRAWLSPHGQQRACARANGFEVLDSGFFLDVLPLNDWMDWAALKEGFYYTLGDYDVH